MHVPAFRKIAQNRRAEPEQRSLAQLVVKHARLESGHRVIAASSPWMAGQDPFDAEPATFQGAVLLYRFRCIVGTRGRIPALVTYQRRKCYLVHLD